MDGRLPGTVIAWIQRRIIDARYQDEGYGRAAVNACPSSRATRRQPRREYAIRWVIRHALRLNLRCALRPPGVFRRQTSQAYTSRGSADHGVCRAYERRGPPWAGHYPRRQSSIVIMSSFSMPMGCQFIAPVRCLGSGMHRATESVRKVVLCVDQRRFKAANDCSHALPRV
jgi:hypothetical protein